MKQTKELIFIISIILIFGMLFMLSGCGSNDGTNSQTSCKGEECSADEAVVQQGEQGDQGIQGEQGPEGEQGPQGEQGPSGIASIAGISCQPGQVLTGIDMNGNPVCDTIPDYDADGFRVDEGDCNDLNPDVNPDATEYQESPDERGSWDYDCDGLESPRWEVFSLWSHPTCRSGWNPAGSPPTPTCGESASWRELTWGPFVCLGGNNETRVQSCL